MVETALSKNSWQGLHRHVAPDGDGWDFQAISILGTVVVAAAGGGFNDDAAEK